MARIVPVILCGGGGARLWPVSRHSCPKQFIRILGELSLFQSTLTRFSDRKAYEKPICITHVDHRFLIAEQLREIGVEADILLEPVRKNSAPAFAAACWFALQRDEACLVLGVAADHVLKDIESFNRTVVAGEKSANAGYLVTFGIKPSHAACGFGYIVPAKAPTFEDGAQLIESFVEKPSSSVAEQLLQDGCYWNSGNLLTRADLFLDELAVFHPEMKELAAASISAASHDLEFVRLAPEPYNELSSISLDYAVLENTRRAVVIEAKHDWQDIGSWQALWEIADKDTENNAIFGEARIIDGASNLVHSEKALTTLIGLDRLAVVVTNDAVLVAPLDEQARIRDCVGALASENRPEATNDRLERRPWGTFEILEERRGYKVKQIRVFPGMRLSLQKHRHRSEHWIILSGRANVTIGGQSQIIEANQSVFVPCGALHRLANDDDDLLELVEVQTGDYLEEDDIVRLSDDYGRDI